MTPWSDLVYCVVMCGFALTDAIPIREQARVVQHSQVSRIRRDTEVHVVYPSTLEFDLILADRTILLKLERQRTTLPRLTPQNGAGKTMYHNGVPEMIQVGVYADRMNSAAMVVKCDTSHDGDCTLKGSYYNDQQKWKLEPYDIKQPNQTYFIEQTAMEEQELLPDFLKTVESAEWRIKRGLNDDPSEYGDDVDGHRQRRGVPEGCNVLEVAVVADFTVYQFFLQLAGNDAAVAMASLLEYYCVLFTEVDLRFCSLLDLKNLCIRIFLTDVVFANDASSSWSLGYVFNGHLTENSLPGCSLKAIDRAGLQDYTICTTRHDFALQSDTRYRVFGFVGQLCVPGVPGNQVGFAEDWHDDTSLLIAHVLAFAFFVQNDINTDCADEEHFIMSLYDEPPTDPAFQKNPWIFSNCSAEVFQLEIDFLNDNGMNCLLNNNFTDAEFDDKLVNQSLAGEIYDVDYQCAYRFGFGIDACIAAGETSITELDDICYLGVWCMVDGACGNRTRVFSGTPCGPGKVCFKNMCISKDGPVTGIGDPCHPCDMPCSDDNALCDLMTDVCVCRYGFFDSDGESGDEGICIPIVPEGDPCNITITVCVDNAFCDENTTLCTCDEEWYPDGNGTCLPVKDLCSNCSASMECYGENTECNMDNMCRCIVGHSTDECGSCTADKELEEDCSNGESCADSCAVCDPKSLICVCFGDTYDNNGGDIGGACVPSEPEGGPCSITITVCVENAFCDENTTVCTCDEGWYPDGNGACLPVKDLCSNCSASMECYGENTECNMDNMCRCIVGHSTDECGSCTADKELEEDCSNGESCADSCAVCDPKSLICVCFGDTYDNNGGDIGGACVPSEPEGDPCSITITVCVENAFCDENTTVCTCAEGWYPDGNGACLPVKDLCSNCSASMECYGENTECNMDNMCRCIVGHSTDECGSCTADKELEEDCSNGESCADSCAVCDPKSLICVCFGDTYDNNGGDIGGACVPIEPEGDPCSITITVCVENAFCDANTNVCTCDEGWYPDGNGACLPVKDLCSNCSASMECYGENTECNMDNMCRCIVGHSTDECGSCTADKELEEDCSNGESCADSCAVCDPKSLICVCFGDTYDNNGGDIGGACVPIEPEGDPCSITITVCVENAFCDANTNVCTCDEGWYPDGNGACLPVKDLCSNCSASMECYGENTECNMDNMCRCIVGHSTDECGSCTADKELEEDCSNGESCADSCAVCDPKSLICVCFGDTYDNNGGDIGGACVPSEPEGDPCSITITVCVENAFCDENTTVCTCDEGWYPDGNGACLPVKDLCSNCSASMECYGENTECNMDNMCRCIVGHSTDECGSCTADKELEEDCSNGESCADSCAVCDPKSLICVCFGDTYDNNGGDIGGACVPSEPEGDPCSITITVCVENAFCDENTTVCTCDEGWYPDGNGACLPVKDLCSNCSASMECYGENTECNMDNMCRCIVGHSTDECGSCTADKELEEDCSNGESCADSCAVCDPKSLICVCFGDTYDNNGGDIGGACVPIEPEGDPCSITITVCVENAFCDANTNVCTCDEGWYPDGNGACLPVKDLCSNCSASMECDGENTECDMENTNMCRCIVGHSTDECGSCTADKQLGDDCSNGESCADPCAVCHPKNLTCVCFGDTYDNNEEDIGGDCVPKEVLGDPCPDGVDACLDCNAECSNSLCRCKDGFVPDGVGICIPAPIPDGICGSCTVNSDCTESNTACVDFEGSMICKCIESHHISECGICVPDILLGGDCSRNGECADPNAICNPSDVCECYQGFFDMEGTCTAKVPLNDPCTSLDECRDVHAECSGTCVCIEGFRENDAGVCVKLLDLCEACTDNDECYGISTVCVNDQCECIDTHCVNSCGECEEKADNGENCTNTGCCKDDNAVCNLAGICECYGDTYDSNGPTTGGTCEDLIPNGNPCPANGICLDPHAVCDTTCVCEDGFTLGIANTCVPLLDLCEACTDNDECYGVLTVCANNQCECIDTHCVNSCGECEEKADNGENCTNTGCCKDDNAVCNLVGICECSCDTYDSNGPTTGGTCEDLIPNGNPCPANGVCLDPYAVCDTTCVCEDGFTLGVANTCVPLLDLCEACTDNDECYGVLTVCANNQCECIDTHCVNSCGECEEKADNGENCTNTGCCKDDNAVCNLAGICECYGDTYDSNGPTTGGTCEDLIPNGNPCPATGVCLDPYAVCDSTCVCEDGFTLGVANTCVPLLDLCEACTDNDECYGVLTVCANNQCECIDTHCVNSCGECEEKADNGENCTNTGCCKDDNAVCNLAGICECYGDTYDSNGPTTGGTCEDQILTGDPCPVNGVCLDPHAVCETDCVCQDGFTLDGADTCVPLSELCPSCIVDTDCLDVNAECVSNECRCLDSHFADECGVCKQDIILGGDCSDNGECAADTNAVCVDGTCVCFCDAYDDNGPSTAGGTCAPTVPNNETCPQHDACADVNAECSAGSICICLDGFELDIDNVCVPSCDSVLDLCEACTEDEECEGVLTECANNQCECIETHCVNSCGECEEKADNGENCTHTGCCKDDNAVCNLAGICECSGDTYDSNGPTTGGTCEDQILTGDPCPVNGVCLDPHAVCETDCVCQDGFTLDDADTCVPLLDLCEACDEDDECYGVSTVCVNDQCECIETHCVNSCGECEEKADNGEICTNTGCCEDDNAVCNLVGICECSGDTYDSNGPTTGGTCEDQILTGDPCPVNGVCLDPHAVCETDCVCQDGFTLDGADTCVPLLDLCEACDEDDECYGVSTVCVNDQCECIETHCVNSCGECEEKADNGEICTNTGCCEDDNAVCNLVGICECSGDTYDSNGPTTGGTCEDQIPNGDPCPVNGVCLDPYAVCDTNCICQDGFLLDIADTCVPLSELCQNCTVDTDCLDVNAECVSNECRCLESHFADECGMCQQDIPLGGDCSDNGECAADTNAVCVDGTCVCFCDAYDDNGPSTADGTCAPTVPNGETCPQPDACADVNAECNAGTICVCLDGFELDINNNCVPSCDSVTGLCNICTVDPDCLGENTECVDTGSGRQCRCEDGYSTDKCGDCMPVKDLDEACTPHDKCGVENAVCSPDGFCKCFCDFFDDNGADQSGMCMQKIETGDPCTLPGSCLDPNAVCGSSNCECKTGFILDNEVCVPNPDENCDVDLCDSCTSDPDCTDPNAVCSGDNECICRTDYFADMCGMCQEKVGLGSNCSTDSMCLDENAVCEPVWGTCLCYGDYYDDNLCTEPEGSCEPKIETGEICSQTDACLDKHAYCTLTSYCECIDGFIKNDDDECVRPKPLGGECTDDDECAGDNVECDDDECTCKSGYEEDSCGNCVDDDDN